MLYEKLGLGADDVKLLVPVTLIVAAAVLTAIGVFDKIASYAGAGTNSAHHGLCKFDSVSPQGNSEARAEFLARAPRCSALQALCLPTALRPRSYTDCSIIFL